MSNSNTKPYKLTRDYLPTGGETILGGVTVASYATLASAVAGARKKFASTSNSSYEIRANGQTLRCLYHHGLPSDSRWDV